MKSFLISLFFFLVFLGQNSLWAQVKVPCAPNVDASPVKIIKQGPEIEIRTLDNYSRLLCQDENFYYFIKTYPISSVERRPEKGHFVESFDKNTFEKVKSEPISIADNKKYMVPLTYLGDNDNVWALCTLTVRAKQETRLYAVRFDKATLKFSGTPKLLASAAFKSYLFLGKFQLRLSNDSSKLLVISQPDDQVLGVKIPGINKPLVSEVMVFDTNFDKIWSKSLETPYTRKFCFDTDLHLDNQGNVYFLYAEYLNNKQERTHQKMPNYVYHLDSYFDNGTTVQQMTIEDKEYFLRDLNIVNAIEPNEFLITGFYGLKESSGLKGMLFMRLNPRQSKVLVDQHYNLSLELIDAVCEKNVEKEWNTFIIKDIIRVDDGGLVIIAEESYIEVHESGRILRYEYYHSEDIIVVNIGADGKIISENAIPKKQVKSGKLFNFDSYSINVVEDKIYLFFNDSDLNFKEGATSTNKFVELSGVPAMAMVVIEQDGKAVKYRQTDPNKLRMTPGVQGSHNISDKQTLIMAHGNKTCRLLLMEFP